MFRCARFCPAALTQALSPRLPAVTWKNNGETLNTFSFDFKDNDIYFKSNAFQPERDLPYVKIMLDHYHTNHTYLECDENTLFSALRDAVDAKDFPGMTDVDSSLLYFCSLVKKRQ